MKKIILLIATVVSCINAIAGTWTIHALKEGYVDFQAWYYSSPSPLVRAYCITFDSEFDRYCDLAGVPEWKDSGTYYIDTDWNYVYPNGITEGDCFSITVPEDRPYFISAGICGPATSLETGWDNWCDVSDFFTGLSGGEFWIDWAENGVARVSTTQPLDFGKWAWDGSVNPSWVEPQTFVQKGKKLGHSK